jgi:broad specificity phosphatase PhoE
MKLALIPCAWSEWRELGRLLGRVELTLTREGHAHCLRWAAQLRQLALARVLHGPDELARQMGRCIGRAAHAPARTVADLREVDLGLWTGLTEEELRTRFPSAHRQLGDAPLTVTPPEGENLAEAAGRLRVCLNRRVKRFPTGLIGLVLRPTALSLMLGVLGVVEESDTWRYAGTDEPLIVDLENRSFEALSSAVAPAASDGARET